MLDGLFVAWLRIYSQEVIVPVPVYTQGLADVPLPLYVPIVPPVDVLPVFVSAAVTPVPALMAVMTELSVFANDDQVPVTVTRGAI